MHSAAAEKRIGEGGGEGGGGGGGEGTQERRGGEESSSVRLNSSGGCVYCHWLKSCMVLKGLPSPPLGGSEQPAAAVFPLDEKLA